MQLRLLLVSVLVAASAGRTLVRRSTATEEADNEASDRSFWVGEWQTVASELAQLRDAAVRVLPHASMLQVAATPKGVGPPPPKPAKFKPINIKELVGLGSEAAKKDDPTVLAPMLAMLKGLYESARSRIGDLNKREKESKNRILEKEKHHKERLAHFDEEYKANKVSLEFYNNSTRDENRMYSYWPRCREREHKQFHNMLKLQHATMEKEKGMIEMYEKAIAGTMKPKEAAKQLGQLTGQTPPEVVLVQTVTFCDESLEQVVAASREFAAEA